MHILGISCYYHDPANLLRGGQLVAAAKEERFPGVKHDSGFLRNVICFCLEAGEITGADLDCVVFFDSKRSTRSGAPRRRHRCSAVARMRTSLSSPRTTTLIPAHSMTASCASSAFASSPAIWTTSARRTPSTLCRCTNSCSPMARSMPTNWTRGGT
jgi:predicted NodU family carbamoyl transferase